MTVAAPAMMKAWLPSVVASRARRQEVATGAGLVPPARPFGLLEPLSVRYLDVIADQVDAQIAAAQRSGRSPAGRPARSHTRSPPPSPACGRPARCRRPSAIGRPQPCDRAFPVPGRPIRPRPDCCPPLPGLPVLVTCSNADVQVTCGEVRHFLAGLGRAPADTDFVPLTGVDHVLKQNPTGAPANYAKPLPLLPATAAGPGKLRRPEPVTRRTCRPCRRSVAKTVACVRKIAECQPSRRNVP